MKTLLTFKMDNKDNIKKPKKKLLTKNMVKS